MALRRLTQINKNITRFIHTTPVLHKMIYTETHEWIYEEVDCTKIGLSKIAIEQLGELVYIDFEVEKGNTVNENEDLVTVESVKAVEAVRSPYDCVILGINTNLEDTDFLEELSKNPECVENNWLIKIDKIP